MAPSHGANDLAVINPEFSQIIGVYFPIKEQAVNNLEYLKPFYEETRTRFLTQLNVRFLHAQESFGSETAAALVTENIIIGKYHELHSRCEAEFKELLNVPNIRKRARLPFLPAQTSELKKWMDQNADDPYPDKLIKDELARQTGLGFDQVTTWFINERMRRSQIAELEGESRCSSRNSMASTDNYYSPEASPVNLRRNLWPPVGSDSARSKLDGGFVSIQHSNDNNTEPPKLCSSLPLSNAQRPVAQRPVAQRPITHKPQHTIRMDTSHLMVPTQNDRNEQGEHENEQEFKVSSLLAPSPIFPALNCLRRNSNLDPCLPMEARSQVSPCFAPSRELDMLASLNSSHRMSQMSRLSLDETSEEPQEFAPLHPESIPERNTNLPSATTSTSNITCKQETTPQETTPLGLPPLHHSFSGHTTVREELSFSPASFPTHTQQLMRARFEKQMRVREEFERNISRRHLASLEKIRAATAGGV